MSCSSTTCTSTNYLETASPSGSNLGWLWRIPIAWLTGIAQFFERRSLRRELLALDDRLLADIGLSRQQIAEDALDRSRTRLTMWHVHR